MAPAQAAAIVDSSELEAALALGTSDLPPNDVTNAAAPSAVRPTESEVGGAGALRFGWLVGLALGVAGLARSAPFRCRRVWRRAQIPCRGPVR